MGIWTLKDGNIILFFTFKSNNERNFRSPHMALPDYHGFNFQTIKLLLLNLYKSLYLLKSYKKDSFGCYALQTMSITKCDEQVISVPRTVNGP